MTFVEYRGRKYNILDNCLDLNIKALKNIDEIQNFTSLINLQILRLSGNRLTEIKSLDYLNQLEILDLSYNQISKIENLKNLTSLRVLNLSGNRITEIGNLDKLNNLEELYLSGNKISNIKSLEKLINLKKLYLSGNIITKINGIDKLHELVVLNLIDNRIKEIRGLEFLFNLESIDLDENKIDENEIDLIEKDPIEIITFCQNKYCEKFGILREAKARLTSKFNSPNIGFLLSTILNEIGFKDECIDALLSLVTKLNFAKHEKEAVCSSILILPKKNINKIEDKIFPKPSSKLNLKNITEISTFAQLIDGCSGTVLIDNEGVFVGNYIFDDTDKSYDPIMMNGYKKAAYSTKITEGLLFLFLGHGSCFIFYRGKLILFREEDKWKLNKKNLLLKIKLLSIIHSIDQMILKKIMKMAFEISKIGSGSLITVGDYKNVLKICDSSSSNHIKWSPIHIDKFNEEVVLGILGQDGATVISKKGEIINSMNTLRPPKGTMGIEEIGKGTRHSTAAKVSGMTNALCIAISQDGPISVYSKGALKLRLFND